MSTLHHPTYVIHPRLGHFTSITSTDKL